MQNTSFNEGGYYHIYNRGVEKRNIFLDEADYWRFIKGLHNANHKTGNTYIQRNKTHMQHEVLHTAPLVDILCYCLMPNHFHILLKQKEEKGISSFMHRLGMGYSKYFNKRYERTGRLFEGVFKTKIITNENYLLHITRYIHLNPVKLIIPNWKENSNNDWIRINKFLENYRWSSYPTYLGLNNHSLVNKEIIKELFNSDIKDYKRFVNEWFVGNSKTIENLLQ